MVVLPLVPVTPTSFNEYEGFPKKFEAACPRAFAESVVLIQVPFLSALAEIDSHITAQAPELTAASI